MEQSQQVGAPNPSMYDIVEGVMSFFDEMEVCADEDRPAIEEALNQFIAVDMARKVDGIAFVGKRCQSEAALMDDVIAEAQKRKQVWLNRERRTRNIVAWAMARLGISLLKGKMHSISLRPGVESLKIEYEFDIPQYFKSDRITMSEDNWERVCAALPEEVKQLLFRVETAKVETVIDTAAVKKALKAGESVPGASLVRGDDILTIR
jgi:hypothetical protein